ncbi:MAG TPA: EAL domain-containing protein [Terriglobales bacterium]
MDLRRGIDQDEFRLYYQPIVDLRTGFISGFEALLRWQPADAELINPYRFIDVAEETGLIVPIGHWVVRAACQQLKVWQQEYRQLSITVNVSPKEFLHPDFVQGIEDVLAETDIPPGFLQLEITESMAMKDSTRTEQVLNRLKDLGVKLSINDFGTGHSSLSRLSRFPLDVLKIDRSFVTGMETDEDKRAVVRLIVTLAHTFKLKIIAEGAETAEQVAQLKNSGCEFVQGYFFSKPMDLEKATSLLQMHFAKHPFDLNALNMLTMTKAAN